MERIKNYTAWPIAFFAQILFRRSMERFSSSGDVVCFCVVYKMAIALCCSIHYYIVTTALRAVRAASYARNRHIFDKYPAVSFCLSHHL